MRGTVLGSYILTSTTVAGTANAGTQRNWPYFTPAAAFGNFARFWQTLSSLNSQLHESSGSRQCRRIVLLASMLPLFASLSACSAASSVDVPARSADSSLGIPIRYDEDARYYESTTFEKFTAQCEEADIMVNALFQWSRATLSSDANARLIRYGMRPISEETLYGLEYSLAPNDLGVRDKYIDYFLVRRDCSWRYLDTRPAP